MSPNSTPTIHSPSLGLVLLLSAGACAPVIVSMAEAAAKTPNLKALDPSYRTVIESSKSWLCVSPRIQNLSGVEQTGTAFRVVSGVSISYPGSHPTIIIQSSPSGELVPATVKIPPQGIYTIDCAIKVAVNDLAQPQPCFGIDVIADLNHDLKEPDQLWADNHYKAWYRRLDQPIDECGPINF